MQTKLLNLLGPIISNPSRRDALRRFLQGGMKKEKKMLLEAIDQSPKSILDFGCGTGEFSEIFPKPSYTGVDIDRLSIDQAKTMHPGYNFSAIRDVTDVTGRYDWVLMIGSAHHIDPELLEKILLAIKNNLLTGDGSLVMMEPVPASEQKTFIGKLQIENDQGHFLRTKSQLQAALDGKFSITKYDTFKENFVIFYLLVARPSP